MWWTANGERVLQGAEAALFRQGLGEVFSLLEADHEDEWSFGAAPFDELQRGQKLAVLAQVARGLLCDEEPIPQLTAVLEATVAAVYRQVRELVELEIHDPEDETTYWRQQVLDAFRESVDDDDVPDAECDDLGEWVLLIDCLADRILWDEDWANGDLYLDDDPESSQHLKKIMGIDPDYFVEVPPDPTDDELDEILDTLRRLTSGRDEEEDLVTGFEDAYHSLLVGPCDEETAQREAERCRYVEEIAVADECDFECSYEEWSEHLKNDARRAAEKKLHPHKAEDVDRDEVRRVQEEGFPDGTRIKARRDGWIVVDRLGFLLNNSDTASWVAEDAEAEEDLQALAFPTPEAAYAAYRCSKAVAKARTQRRKAALERLGKGTR